MGHAAGPNDQQIDTAYISLYMMPVFACSGYVYIRVTLSKAMGSSQETTPDQTEQYINA